MPELDGAWRYPFFGEIELRRQRIVLRPIVPISMAGLPLGRALDGLVDSGSESTLIARWVADLLGIDLRAPDEILTIGVGGATVEARFVEVELRLQRWPDENEGATSVAWRTEVGFVTPWRPLYPILLGQRGFLDQFTVTISRFAQELTVESIQTYDQRFSSP